MACGVTGMLQVENLTVTPSGARARPILRDVSLALDRGDVVGLVGGSGSGKSTLARCLVRLEAPLVIRAGRIGFQGRDLAALPQREMRGLRGRHIAMMQQDPTGALDPIFTLGSQLREFADTHGPRLADQPPDGPPGRMAEGRIDGLLSRVGIENPGRRHRQYPHQWSRGMLQRTLLALAAWPAPALLVLDEPTASLDPPIADRLLNDLMRTVAQHRLGVLLITHDLAVAAQVCQRIAVLYRGRIVESGPSRTILSNPGHDYTRALVASADW